MKTKIWMVALLLLTVTALSAQKKHTTKFGGTGEKKVVFELSKFDLIIETHASNEILIETDKKYKIPERAKGLKPLSNGAKDNTEMGLEVKKSGNTITVKKAGNKYMKYKVKLPKDTHISVKEYGWSNGDIHVKGITSEVEIKGKSASMKLEDVTGPLVLNTTNGSIDIHYSTVSKNPSAISSINGEIDITMDAATKANFKLSSYNGEIYTDLDIQTSEDGKMKTIGGHKVKGKLNGGGTEISVRSINANIYLRKKK
jgi:hypothetical protein